MDTSSSTNSYVRAEASIAEAEFLEQMKSRQLSAKGTRIKQGIPQDTETINYANTIKLDEALDAVRGISSSDSEKSARDRLLLRKGKQSGEKPRQAIEATKVTAHQHHDFELANTWANMLQNAEIKASLEAKISAISGERITRIFAFSHRPEFITLHFRSNFGNQAQSIEYAKRSKCPIR